MESPRRLLRTPTTLDFPHDRFTVPTSDGVDIRGYHAHTLPDQKLRRSVVIIAHGGFRSKDILIKALMTAWLSDDFDVISFDFRGHGESGGVWTGDGKTVADLKAVVDFARKKGYQKIGVYGRSMGGWTAILEAVDYHDVDAIVIAGMPPGFFSEVPEFQGSMRLLRCPGASLIIRILMGVRFTHFEDVRSPIKEIGQVSPIPLLILYNQADPAAGVAGVPGYWESIPPDQRRASVRKVEEFHFTAQQVYDAAREPKELYLLPGAVHVYSLGATRALFTQVERWFEKYLYAGDESLNHILSEEHTE
jgi:pimeloyl-ACP methyl ester carboxylesterase